MSPENRKRISFLYARSNLQRVTRHEDNLKYIKENNNLMHADLNDKDKVFAIMKAARREKVCPPTKLVTPVGEYTGADILEGFAADSEKLGQAKGECEGYDNDFYRLCIMDNMFIFDFKGEDQIKIPEMSKEAFEEIIYKNMKPGKACDV